MISTGNNAQNEFENYFFFSIQLICGDIYGQMNATLQFKQSYYQTLQLQYMLHAVSLSFFLCGAKYSTLNMERVHKFVKGVSNHGQTEYLPPGNIRCHLLIN